MEDTGTEQRSIYTKQERRSEKRNKWFERDPRKEQRKRTLFGLGVITFGLWWLLRRMDIEIAPDWVFTWPMLVIVLGAYNVIANGFKASGGYIAILVGSFFLARNVFDIPVHIEPYFWPAIVIGVGLIILFKSRKKWDPEKKLRFG